MRLNDAGRIVSTEWMKTAKIRAEIELDAWTVMPNHLHGILVVSNGRGTARRAPAVEMTVPDTPNKRLQKYRLTEKGKTALEEEK